MNYSGCPAVRSAKLIFEAMANVHAEMNEQMSKAAAPIAVPDLRRSAM